MAPTLPKEVVAAIEVALARNREANRHPDMYAVAEVFNCSYQTVRHIKLRVETFLQTGVDDRKKSGRKPKFNELLVIQEMRALLARQQGLDQSAVSDYLFETFGVRYTKSAISRMYTKYQIPHKVSNKMYGKSKIVLNYKRGQIGKEQKAREAAMKQMELGTGALPVQSGVPLQSTPNVSVSSFPSFSPFGFTPSSSSASPPQNTAYVSPYPDPRLRTS